MSIKTYTGKIYVSKDSARGCSIFRGILPAVIGIADAVCFDGDFHTFTVSGRFFGNREQIVDIFRA